MTKRKTPLPDRWDFDQWRMGSPLNPPKGHKVSMYWGEYLTLEHFMRKIAGDLELARKEIEHLADILNKGTTEEDHWRLSPDFSMAQDTVDNVEFVLANIRRTGKWPNPEDEGWPEQRNIIAGGDYESPEPSKCSSNNDDEIPF